MLYSPKHNACVYTTPDTQRILSCVPESRLIRPDTVVVPCEVVPMQIMRHIGFEAMSPILATYDWPIIRGRKPFEHQPYMASFMTLHPRAFNLSDIGTAKTLGTLWAADYLMREGIIKRCLIMSPLSTLRRVWEDEIYQNFLSSRRCVILHGDRNKRLALLNTPADFYVINHDGLGVGTARNGNRGMVLGKLAQQIQSREDINAVIVDEGSVYKDSGTMRYKVLRHAISEKPYIWWLTGTPTPNAPTDAHAQARIVRADYKESFNSFRDRTMQRVTQFKYFPKPGSEDLVAEVLQPAIRFTRDECLDLPPLMVQDREVELTTAQKSAYAELKKSLKTEIGSGQITALNEAGLRLKFIQIACGAVYDANHNVHKLDASPRLNALKEVIEEAGGKILVFVPLTSLINLLHMELSKEYAVEKINGEVSATKRNQVFSDFQQSINPRIIVADPRTMAHGLTLTAAATIIWYGPTDMPEVYQQANGRINRPGQTRSMLVVRLTSTPTEREIYKRLDNKESMQGLILNLIEGE